MVSRVIHATLLLGLVARLAVAEAPAIEHTPVDELEEGADLVVLATVRSRGGVLDARVFWRSDGARFRQVPLTKGAAHTFSARIQVPAGARGLQYYLFAADAKSLAGAQWRSNDAPQDVVIKARPSAVEVSVSTSPSVTPADRPPPALRPPRLRRVAVYDLTSEGVEERVTAIVTEGLLAELRKVEGLGVLGMNEVRAMLAHEANKQLLGCDDDSCLAEIAGSLGVEQLVVGQLGRVGESHVFSAKLIDTTQAKTLQTVARRVPVADGQEFLALVAPIVQELFPGLPLRPGLVRGVNAETVQWLHPPPLRRWVFYATTGVGVATAGIASAFTIGAFSAKSEWDALVETGRTRPVDGGQLHRLETTAADRAFTGQVLFGVASTLALTAVIEALFTDWHGYQDRVPGQPVAPRE